MCIERKALVGLFQVAEHGNYCQNDNIAADGGFVNKIKAMKLFSGKRVISIGEGPGNIFCILA